MNDTRTTQQNPNVDYAAVVTLLENHWEEFVEWSGGEASAERSLQALKADGDIL